MDGDGDLFEPDGVLDHVVLVHAGADQADGGGEQGTYAEWSNARPSTRPPAGTRSAAPAARCFNFTTQPEDAGVGVIAHEYGHDLGLPDLYDSVGPGDTDVGFWDLMSTGSHRGPLFQTIPTHMGAWSKYVLGWVEPEVLRLRQPPVDVTLGQASRPPRGTEDAVQDRTCPTSTSRSARRTAARTLVVQQRPELRRPAADPPIEVPAGATSGSGRGTTT